MSIGGWLVGFGIWITLSLTAFGLFEARGLRHADRQGVYMLSFALYKIGSTFPLVQERQYFVWLSEPGNFWPSMYSLPRNTVLH